MGIPLYQVDAFADRPFRGNPAAVCLLGQPASEEWMRDVAGEMNLSETAFLHPEGEGFRLRWFTPKVEVDLCGHATLAAAHALWESDRLSADRPALFHTRSGRLTARRRAGWIEMDFPAEPPVPDALAPAWIESVGEALGVRPESVCRNRMDILAEVDTEDIVRMLRPDFRRLAALPARGLIVTGPSRTAGCDFVSRFFAPAIGIDEDPVTGSAHCFLGPYWRDRLKRNELVGHQASSRGGVVRIRVEDERVFLSGRAVTILAGTLQPESERSTLN